MLMAMAQIPTDNEPQALIALVVAGDRDAFRRLAMRLHGPALRLATKVLTDRAEAEDAVQVALTKLWTSARLFDVARGSVEGWFRRLVVNACIDRRRTIKPVAPIEAAADAPSSDPTPHEAAEGSERDRAVSAAVARLVPRQRAAIALFYGDGTSMAEIAAILETTPKAVEGLLTRARAELAEMLGQLRDK
jgi:RNA polymerase sigma-70 factor (ECF subfamily)